MEPALFKEVQYFRKTFILILVLVLFLVVLAIFSYGVLLQIFYGVQFGSKNLSDLNLILVSIFSVFITGLLLWLVLISRLELILNQNGLYFKYYPFLRRMRYINVNEIKEYYYRKYRPIVEYGGWGIRFSMKGKGIAYNVAGNEGIQFELTNGKLILFGTKRPDDFIHALDKLFRK